MKKRTTTRPYTLRVLLSEIEKAQLDHLASTEGKTASDIIRWILSEYYKKANAPDPQKSIVSRRPIFYR